MDPETPEADAAEQARPAANIDDGADEDLAEPSATADANPADFVEQQRHVPDEDPDERG